MQLPISIYQGTLFSITSIGMVMGDKKLYPGVHFHSIQAPMAEVFEGHVIVIEDGHVYLDGEDLGASMRLFNCPRREIIARWIKGMLDTEALVLVAHYDSVRI